MSQNLDIPDDYRESLFRDYVHTVTADAVIACQYTERVLNFVCLIQPSAARAFGASTG
jgi:hypothetical protein